MKIRYKKKTLYLYLILGIIGFALAISRIWLLVEKDYSFNKVDFYFAITGIIISLSWGGLYFYSYYFGYLTINYDFIINNSSFRKKLKLSEIKQIKKFAGDYILKTNDKEMTINTQMIDPKSLEKLNSELGKLNVSWL